MREKDIKIGDYFSVNGEVVKVQETEFNLCGIWDSQENYHVVGYEMLEPIPLTVEILEKNGWEYSEPFNDWTYSICENVKEYSIYKGGRGFIIKQYQSITDLHTIAYVHELQHILWALGIDDNLKL